MPKNVEFAGWILTAIAVACALRSACPSAARFRIAWIWRGVLFSAVIAFRWPMLTAPYDFNPDESQSIAGALTLLHDPRFWISLDGATAGPLHFLLQIPAVLFPGAPPYLIARLIGLVLVMGEIFLIGWLLDRLFRPALGFVVVLPLSIAWGLCRMPDTQHLSTEVLASFLGTVAVTLLPLDQANLDGNSVRRPAMVGLILGAIPFAKLQAAPIAVMLGVIAWRRFRSQVRNLRWLAVASLLPTIITAVYLTISDAWPSFIVSYLQTNVSYTMSSSLSLAEDVGSLVLGLFNEKSLALWFISSLLLLLLTPIWAPKLAKKQRSTYALAAVWLLASLGCVFAPQRPFLHYIHLLVPPWLLLVGCSAGSLWTRFTLGLPSRSSWRIAALLAVFLLPQALIRNDAPDDGVKAYFAELHQQNVALAAQIKTYQEPGDTLAIWGWRSDLYVQTRLAQAIPQAHSQNQITPGSSQRFFLHQYWEAFAARKPAIFVDAVGPGNFGFSHRGQAHEAFALLGRAVKSDYTLVVELHGVRIYVRNDRLSHSKHTPRLSS